MLCVCALRILWMCLLLILYKFKFVTVAAAYESIIPHKNIYIEREGEKKFIPELAKRIKAEQFCEKQRSWNTQNANKYKNRDVKQPRKVTAITMWQQQHANYIHNTQQTTKTTEQQQIKSDIFVLPWKIEEEEKREKKQKVNGSDEKTKSLSVYMVGKVLTENERTKMLEIEVELETGCIHMWLPTQR